MQRYCGGNIIPGYQQYCSILNKKVQDVENRMRQCCMWGQLCSNSCQQYCSALLHLITRANSGSTILFNIVEPELARVIRCNNAEQYC